MAALLMLQYLDWVKCGWVMGLLATVTMVTGLGLEVLMRVRGAYRNRYTAIKI